MRVMPTVARCRQLLVPADGSSEISGTNAWISLHFRDGIGSRHFLFAPKKTLLNKTSYNPLKNKYCVCHLCRDAPRSGVERRGTLGVLCDMGIGVGFCEENGNLRLKYCY